jgi:hypothetical protein
MLSWLWRTPASEKKAEPAPDSDESLVNTVEKTHETIDDLQVKRIGYLYKASKHHEEAKLLHAQGKKAQALSQMKYKKLWEDRAARLEAQIDNLEKVNLAVNDAATAKDLVNTLKAGSESIKTLTKQVSIDDVERIQDDLEENMLDANDISQALARPIGGSVDPDVEEALLAEMEGWDEQKRLEEADLVEKSLPKVPVGEVGNSGGGSGGGRGGPLLREGAN